MLPLRDRGVQGKGKASRAGRPTRPAQRTWEDIQSENDRMTYFMSRVTSAQSPATSAQSPATSAVPPSSDIHDEGAEPTRPPGEISPALAGAGGVASGPGAARGVSSGGGGRRRGTFTSGDRNLPRTSEHLILQKITVKLALALTLTPALALALTLPLRRWSSTSTPMRVPTWSARRGGQLSEPKPQTPNPNPSPKP